MVNRRVMNTNFRRMMQNRRRYDQNWRKLDDFLQKNTFTYSKIIVDLSSNTCYNIYVR